MSKVEYAEACYRATEIVKDRPFNDDQRATVIVDEDTGKQVWHIPCDKGGEENLSVVELAAAHFPPGTHIIIYEPIDEHAINWYPEVPE